MIKHKELQAWIDEVADLCQPDNIVWINGSEEQNQQLLDEMVENGMAIELNQEKRPGCYLFRSDPSMLLELKSAHTLQQKKKKMPVRLTTGSIR